MSAIDPDSCIIDRVEGAEGYSSERHYSNDKRISFIESGSPIHSQSITPKDQIKRTEDYKIEVTTD